MVRLFDRLFAREDPDEAEDFLGTVMTDQAAWKVSSINVMTFDDFLESLEDAFRENLIGRTCALEFKNVCQERQVEMLADMKPIVSRPISPRSSTRCANRRSGRMARAVAIFDLDGTLVVGQTQVLLVRFLRRQRVVSRAFVLGTALWFLAYKARLVKVTEASRANWRPWALRVR